ncbi:MULTISPECIES: FAD-dependent monooxygenase [unclassified Saccharopolyspora]|uniref:FAD-dependent monooxygenase n=1 Tax=unclassified Saccharopolyspora TaxID=2646250 RepID=UPI001CD2B8D8|nr:MULTISPECIES: FAD-dependent monooxygenase [unclassified Saccharopolyspora]MCA1186726.1 FAD-dependent monooxygenase [Saccharopolyspora sp. 6T]MCA1194587.1 FAD-dependent monooxygenase [Saccharopolyspora sp. 6V]MCA1226612.1 FAD-dependent monooxygenase [Saccharopolyspora sp. 6M]
MTTDVVIAGAGPNGLMLACELSLAGIRPLVLERLPGRTAEHRANGLVGQVVRMLDRRGLYERLNGNSGPPQPIPAFAFGAMRLELEVLDDNPMYALGVPQRRIEQVLEERALELGAEIRRGHELVGLAQDTDFVAVDVVGPDGPHRLRARYLVGADGGRSQTRKLSGIGFPGATKDDVVSRLAHVTVPPSLVDPTTLGLNVPGHGFVPPFIHHRTERGVLAYAPFPGGAPLVSTMEWSAGPTDQPMTVDELHASASRVLGADLPLGPPEGDGPHQLRRLASGNTRLADRFRDRRVLLVGDAAHVHSAIGGPGLNLGLQDAVNLGWKLAAELHGWAPPGLLDSYETERRTVARRVVMHTLAQSALLSPGDEIGALRELFGELLHEPRNVQHIADLMSGADVRYEMGIDAEHPLVGRWAPDLRLDTAGGSVRLAELTADARPLLLDTTGSLVDALSGWRDRVQVVTGRADTSTTAMLLRPDGYTAWASNDARPDARSLREALTKWFGPATAGA